MFKTSKFTKTTAITLASAMFVSSLGTTVTASAHDRHQPGKHGADHYNWNKKSHRNFHRTYGRGQYGVQNYRHELEKQRQAELERQRQQQQTHAHANRKNRKRAKRAAIIAGVIGLAAGAIIANQSTRNRTRVQHNAYAAPLPRYTPSQNQVFDDYSNNSGTDVVTYRDTVSTEPWTPGWREWCENRYRSFNANTGTYRGYDGLDHFCVPK